MAAFGLGGAAVFSLLSLVMPNAVSALSVSGAALFMVGFAQMTMWGDAISIIPPWFCGTLVAIQLYASTLCGHSIMVTAAIALGFTFHGLVIMASAIILTAAALHFTLVRRPIIADEESGIKAVFS